jgi:hypothetical protein
METDYTEAPRSEPPAPTELRALVQLRERVEAAAREIERLRAENEALAARVAALQDQHAPPASSPFALPEGEDVEKLKAKIQGFIDAIDRVLNAPEPAGAARHDG